MGTKIFTIIVPVYNAEKTIERTLASFISNRKYIYEVILVNDGSTDNTFNKVEQFSNFFNIRVMDNRYGKGAGSARKTGIIQAKSEWITFVDADDCLTASSLHYVYEKIKNAEKKMVLLHCQSIYYESGTFNKETITHSDFSCGGNFYNRKYITKNKLYPHDELYMVEDEYFNEKIKIYMVYCDIFKRKEEYYDYPVYEVHHDGEKSFALRNWIDYCCKYRLIYKKYLVEHFKRDKKAKEGLMIEYMDNYIFCYYLAQGLILDKNEDFSLIQNQKYYKEYIEYFKKMYGKDEEYLIEYYYSNKENVEAIKESAFLSIGFRYKSFISFEEFVLGIKG